MIYTRYLYDKKCVEYSLFVSLLNKNKEEALFWGLELFHSGFKDELIVLLWRYYYELYAPFYINLEAHILKYTKLWMNNRLDDTYIATIITNLCERDACVDFYIMYTPLNIFKRSKNVQGQQLPTNQLKGNPPVEDCSVSNVHRCKNGVASPKCLSGVFEQINRSDNIDDIYNIALNTAKQLKLFKTRSRNALNNINIVFETIPLPICIYKSAMKSRLITGIFLTDEDNRYDPKFYIILKHGDISKYKTKPIIHLKGWKIPPRECVYTLHLKPSTQEKIIGQYDNWLYYASKSPIWEKRIVRHKGIVDTVNKTVYFENVDNEESFFNMYNYEPDEQSSQTQNKWFGRKTYETWDHIYEKHKCEPYNEWLTMTSN